jgi:hypothetical protein
MILDVFVSEIIGFGDDVSYFEILLQIRQITAVVQAGLQVSIRDSDRNSKYDDQDDFRHKK